MEKSDTIKERISVLEEQGRRNQIDNSNMLAELKSINEKLDGAIRTKADREELKELNSKLWGFVTIIITAFVGLLVYMIQGNMK